MSTKYLNVEYSYKIVARRQNNSNANFFPLPLISKLFCNMHEQENIDVGGGGGGGGQKRFFFSSQETFAIICGKDCLNFQQKNE